VEDRRDLEKALLEGLKPDETQHFLLMLRWLAATNLQRMRARNLGAIPAFRPFTA
jgi:hypothetical protein